MPFSNARVMFQYMPAILFLAAVLVSFHGYISLFDTGSVIGIAALFICSEKTGENYGSMSYGIIALIAAVLYVFYPLATLLYAAAVCGSLFYINRRFGFRNRYALLIIFLMSPVFQYISGAFGFPIRLQLTEWAAWALGLFDHSAHALGNVILFRGREFSVDPACMGLNMLATSLLSGIMILRVYETKYQKPFRWQHIIVALLVFLALNVFANLLRIISLVLFNIPPENLMHDVCGLICLFAYSILPSTLLARFFIRHIRPRKIKKTEHMIWCGIRTAISQVTLTLLIIGCTRTLFFSKEKIMPSAVPIPGYKSVPLPNDVLKLTNEKALVYIKHVRGFYSTDHHPSICWRGSGYNFEKTQTVNISGYNIFEATLSNKGAHLYTAWWYDNGQNRTTDQWNWRWDELKSGRHYSIINVTTADKILLNEIVVNALRANTFNPAL